jgi:hypothetical protein
MTGPGGGRRLAVMSWALGSGWISAAGLLLLTFGTGAQALSNLAEFETLRRTIPKAAIETLRVVATVEMMGGSSLTSRLRRRLNILHIRLPEFPRVSKWLLIARMAVFTLVLMPMSLKQIRTDGGEEAVQLVRFARAAEVWAILMIGSALALIAAIIQLVLAY